MLKNRISYIGIIVLLAVMFFFFSKPFLLYSIIILLIVPIFIGVMLKIEIGNISVGLDIKNNGQQGRITPMSFRIYKKHKIFFLDRIYINVEIENKTFDTSRNVNVEVQLNSGSKEFNIDMPAMNCGKIKITCISIKAVDIMSLFKFKMEPFSPVSTIVYPRNINIRVEATNMSFGNARQEGHMLNKKGNDPSEIFDIREYKPGDDIRSIHWKLTSKMDDLILREASEPTHYQVALMPDFGLNNNGNSVSSEEINTAVALFYGVGEQLVKQRIKFCAVIPTANGLYTNEIKNLNEFNQVVTNWLCMKMPEKSGDGLKYFIMDNMENNFSKLIVISASRYNQEMNGLDERMGVILISAVKEKDKAFLDVTGKCEVLEVPVNDDYKEIYKIIC